MTHQDRLEIAQRAYADAQIEHGPHPTSGQLNHLLELLTVVRNLTEDAERIHYDDPLHSSVL